MRHRLCTEDEVPLEGSIIVPFFGREVHVYRSGERIRVAANTCMHFGGPLECKGGALVCPWHGASYDMDSGLATDGPVRKDARLMFLSTRVENGDVNYVWGEQDASHPDKPSPVPLRAARGDRACREECSVRADLGRPFGQAGMVHENLAARQGSGAAGDRCRGWRAQHLRVRRHLEYLEETAGAPLHPADPIARARHRGWIEYGSQVLNAIWRLYSAMDEAVFEKERAALSAMFETIEAELSGGPFFAGGAFSLVDAVFAPVFRYFDAFDKLGVTGMLDGKPKVAAWRERLAERDSVRTAVVENFAERLMRFLDAKNGVLVRQRLAA